MPKRVPNKRHTSELKKVVVEAMLKEKLSYYETAKRSSFRAEVEVTTSQMFFSWIFGLGGRVMINGPQRVKDEYEKMVRDAAANLSLQLCERLK